MLHRIHSELRPVRTPVELLPPDWAEYLRYLAAWDLPDGFYAGVDPRPFHLLLAGLDGRTVGSALAFDLVGNCGIYNVSTLEPARRRGIGTALTALALQHAAARGCRTATLQATPMAERIYAGLGFRDLGRFLEYAPA